MKNLNKKSNVVMLTIVQYVVCGVLLFLFLTFVSEVIEQNGNLATSKLLLWFINGMVFIMPVIIAFIYFLGINKGKLYVSLNQLLLKKNIVCLALRCSCIVCFVLLGIFIELITKKIYSNLWGHSILTQSTFYIWTALFPASYAIFDSIFAIEEV